MTRREVGSHEEAEESGVEFLALSREVTDDWNKEEDWKPAQNIIFTGITNSCSHFCWSPSTNWTHRVLKIMSICQNVVTEFVERSKTILGKKNKNSQKQEGSYATGTLHHYISSVHCNALDSSKGKEQDSLNAKNGTKSREIRVKKLHRTLPQPNNCHSYSRPHTSSWPAMFGWFPPFTHCSIEGLQAHGAGKLWQRLLYARNAKRMNNHRINIIADWDACDHVTAIR